MIKIMQSIFMARQSKSTKFIKWKVKLFLFSSSNDNPWKFEWFSRNFVCYHFIV